MRYYTLSQRTEDLTVYECRLINGDNGYFWIARNEYSNQYFLKKVVDAKLIKVDFELCLAGVTLLNNWNLSQLTKAKKITSRDIHYLPHDHLDAYYKFIKNYHLKYIKRDFMKKKEFITLMEDILWPIAEEIELPSVDVVKYSWTITEDVIAETNNPECINYLQELKQHKYILKESFEEIVGKIKQLLPDKDSYSPVISKLRSTKSTKHLAILALTEDDGKLFINMSNEAKIVIKLDAYKFLHLVKTSQATHIYTYPPKRFQERFVEFEMSGRSEGVVFGKFIPQKSCLEIIVAQDENSIKQINTREFFIIESSYLLMLYYTLTQLDKDKRLFEDRVREAGIEGLESDPFENLPIII